MIPVTLSFQAFESYAKMQTIDFKKLSDGGMFLIHGETGAGKSAILDAITYSLFGQTSGGSRSQVRCFYQCAAQLPTITDFVFSLKGKQYRFERKIRLKKNRTASGVYNEDDYVFEHNAYYIKDGEWFPFFANPKMKAVNQKAEELLGLTAEQFRQVIILPQGQFESFLTSDSDKKEEVLTTLFGAEKYTRISSKLQQMANERQKEIALKLQKTDGLLESTGASGEEELEALISTLSSENALLREEYSRLSKEAKAQGENFEKAKELSGLFDRNEEYAKKLEGFFAKEPEIKSTEKAVNKAKLAGLVKPLYEKLKSAKNEEESRKESVLRAEKALRDAKQRLDNEKEAFEELQKQIPKAEELEKRIAASKEKIPVYKSFGAAEKELSISRGELEAVKKEDDGIKALIKASAEKLIAAEKKERELLRLSAEEFPKAAREKDRLSEGERLSKKLAEYEKLLTEIENERAFYEKELSELKLISDNAENAYDEAERKRTLALAAQLAEELKDGSACPVCGSVHHPKPAADVDSSVTEAELKELSKALKTAKSKESDGSLKLEKIILRIQNGKRIIFETKEQLEPLGYTPEGFKKAEALFLELEEKLSKTGEIRIKVEALKVSAENEKVRADSIAERLLEATARFSRAEAEYNSLILRMDREFESLEALEKFIESSEGKLEAFRSRISKAEENLKLSDNAYNSSLLGQKLSNEEHAAALKNKENAEAEFLNGLSQQGFESLEEWQNNNLSEEEISEKQRAVTEFFTAYALLRTDKSALELQLQGKERPETEAMEKLLNELLKGKEEHGQKLAVATREEERLMKILSDYRAQTAEINLKKRKADEQSRFAKLMAGDKSQSFTRFVLGIRLDEITAAANVTLKDVLGGQFQLFRKTEGELKNKKTGLELEVLSALASSKYSTKNLSGGEKFLLSLALSIALSSVLVNKQGGMSIDALFIDEGFGSLDSEALAEALTVLSTAVKSRETVGIISHVTELTELIPRGLKISRSENGSCINVY